MTPSISRLASFTPILWRFLKEPVAHNAYPSIRVLLLHRSMWAALFAHALQNRRSSVLIPFSSFPSASAAAAVTHPPLPPPTGCTCSQSFHIPLHSTARSARSVSCRRLCPRSVCGPRLTQRISSAAPISFLFLSIGPPFCSAPSAIATPRSFFVLHRGDLNDDGVAFYANVKVRASGNILPPPPLPCDPEYPHD